MIAAATAALFAAGAHAATTEFIIYKLQNFQGDAQTVKGEVNVLEGGFAKDASSLRVRGGYWEVCNQDHFKGDCRVLAAGDYPKLDYVLDDRIVSVRYLGTDAKLQQRVAKIERVEGRPETIRERQARYESRGDSRYTQRDERRNMGAIDLYGQPEFRGRSVRIEDTVDDLADRRFDGRASSVVVHEGTWQLCSEPGFRGQCATLKPGEYRQLAGLDDRVSSLRQLR